MGKKVKLPKRVWGVKIPKSIRKGPIASFLGSSGGQIVLAEAFLAATAYYAARRIDPDSPVGETLRHPIDGLRAGRDWSRGTSDRFARAVRAGVQSFRAALQEPSVLATDAQTLGAATENATEVPLDPDSLAKKSRSSRRESRREEEATTGPH